MNAEDQLLIDKYLDGDLTPEELATFKQRLENEPALLEAVKLQQSMLGHLEQLNTLPAFQQNLEKIGANYFQDPKHKKGKNIWWIALLIAALVIIGLLYLLGFLSQKTTDPQEIYQQVAQHQALEIVDKSGDSLNLIPAIEEAYNSGNYNEVLSKLDEYLAMNPDDNLVLLSKGIALLETNAIKEAQAIFDNIQQGQSLYQTDAQWYYALSFLKAGDLDTAKDLLQSIPESSPYYEKARLVVSGK